MSCVVVLRVSVPYSQAAKPRVTLQLTADSVGIRKRLGEGNLHKQFHVDFVAEIVEP